MNYKHKVYLAVGLSFFGHTNNDSIHTFTHSKHPYVLGIINLGISGMATVQRKKVVQPRVKSEVKRQTGSVKHYIVMKDGTVQFIK